MFLESILSPVTKKLLVFSRRLQRHRHDANKAKSSLEVRAARPKLSKDIPFFIVVYMLVLTCLCSRMLLSSQGGGGGEAVDLLAREVLPSLLQDRLQRAVRSVAPGGDVYMDYV